MRGGPLGHLGQHADRVGRGRAVGVHAASVRVEILVHLIGPMLCRVVDRPERRGASRHKIIGAAPAGTGDENGVLGAGLADLVDRGLGRLGQQLGRNADRLVHQAKDHAGVCAEFVRERGP